MAKTITIKQPEFAVKNPERTTRNSLPTMSAIQPAPEGENERLQIFTCVAPEAKEVKLVGDFTNWQEKPIPMNPAGKGRWRTQVELEPGAHHYRFLVDHEWRDDPNSLSHAPNPFGGIDAVREVN